MVIMVNARETITSRSKGLVCQKKRSPGRAEKDFITTANSL
jgi:hypothetical protein